MNMHNPPQNGGNGHGGGKGKGAGRRKSGRTPKGRQIDPAALADVQALLTDRPRRRDLLIEHLHLIQDHYGHISAPHLAALAFEMKMAQAEVYEVATFYAHFDVVKDGPAPPPVTIRVCDSLSCAMAGAEKLLAALPGALGKDVRVVRAPCMGACDRAPVAAVGHVQTFHATVDNLAAVAKAKPHAHAWHPSTDFAAYRQAGGYALLKDVLAGKNPRRACSPSIATRASPVRSRIVITSKSIRTVSSKACCSRPTWLRPPTLIFMCATSIRKSG